MPYIAPEVVHFSGNTYTTRSHDSLKISNGKWMWWSQSISCKFRPTGVNISLETV